MYQRTNMTPTPEHIEKIELQIGRAPRGIQAVTATDSLGTPLVVRMHSIVDKKPFPTLYWMTSNLLKKEKCQKSIYSSLTHLQLYPLDFLRAENWKTSLS